jgi:hypothetical protein
MTTIDHMKEIGKRKRDREQIPKGSTVNERAFSRQLVPM